MPDDPVACTLNPKELLERVEEISAIGQEALLSADATGPEALLRFRSSAVVRERLESIVAAEARCCAFLRFELTETPEALLLSIRAPDGGEQVVHELAAAFGGLAYPTR